MTEPVSSTTTARRPATPDPGAPGPEVQRPSDRTDLAGDVAQAACNCLHVWLRKDSPPLSAWLLTGGQDRLRRLTALLVESYNECRRAKWLEYLLTRKEPWGRWVDGTVPRIYEVIPPAEAGDGLLRVPSAFGPEDLLTLHRRYAHAPPSFKQIEGRLAAILSGCVSVLLREAGERDEPAPDAARRANDRLIAALHLPRPPQDPFPPPGLHECLRVLLRPAEPLWGWGCLTRDCGVRLFRFLPRIAEPYLAAGDFERLEAVVKKLQAWVKDPAGIPAGMLPEQLELLGRAAGVLEQVLLPGRDCPGHRLWLSCLLENFRRLGQLARLTRPEPEEEAPSAPTPPARGESSGEVSDPNALAAPGQQGDAATARGSVPGTAEPGSQDLQVAELVRAYPEHVGALVEISRLALEVRDRCAQAGWKQAVDALEGVRAKCRQHLEGLLNRTAGVPPAGRDNLVRPRSVTVTDELLNNLKQLDPLLPGEGEDGPLPPQSPAHLDESQRLALCRLVQQVRDRLFAFMGKHGGYRAYPVEIGDTMTRHNGLLNILSPRDVAARRLPQHTVAQILQPGYVVDRQGNREVKVYPSVRLAK